MNSNTAIQTLSVGALRAAIANLPDDTMVVLHNPATEWYSHVEHIGIPTEDMAEYCCLTLFPGEEWSPTDL